MVLVMVLGGIASAVGAGFSDEFEVPGADSQAATDLLVEKFPAAAGDSTQVVVHSDEECALGDGSARSRVRWRHRTIDHPDLRNKDQPGNRPRP